MRLINYGLTCAICLTAGCGKDGGGSILQKALCGSGHAKGKMTLGLNFDFFNQELRLAESGLSNDGLKSFLNSGLGKVVGEDTLSVKSVESIGDDKDDVRFLQMSGSFADGFGIATDLIKQAFAGGTELTDGDGPFSFIGESFNVQSATRIDPYSSAIARAPSSHASSLTTVVGGPHPDQWSLHQTDYEKAAELYRKLNAKQNPTLKKAVRVAVLDTGVDLDHPDLKPILEEGYDALGTGSGTQDENGHGTHCAGIIAAQATTTDSPMGVAKEASIKILPVKVLDKNGSGDFQAIEKGIRWAVSKGVDVISLSLGAGLEYSDVKKTANPLKSPVIKDAIDKGVIVVVAAGNEACELGGTCKNSGGLFSKEYSEYTVVPCSYEGTVCVGATNSDETFAVYSNYSSKKQESYRTKADVNAPGTAIFSTWPRALPGNGYKTISGTSMATPYVAGVAALLKSLNKDLKQDDVRTLLKAGQAYPEDVKAKSEEGRVDLYATLVAFANSDFATPKADAVPAKFTPNPNPVEAPATGEGNDGDLISSLWNAVCQ